MGEYKELSITTPDVVRDAVLAENLLFPFPPEDLFFETRDGLLILHLRQVDFKTLEERAEALRVISPPETTAILTEIIKKIGEIKSYGIKGKKRLYVDYNKERKVQNRTAKEGKRGVHFYTQDHDFSEKNFPVPEEYQNQIVCADSESFLKMLPANCIDLIFTSPPYNFGLDYSSTEDDHGWKSYFDKLFAVFTECIRVLKFGGRIIVNVQPLYSDYIPSHHLISQFFIEKKLIWKGEILWEKNNYNCKYTAWGSWKSPSNPYLKYSWEFLEIFAKGSLKMSGAKENADIESEEFKKWVYGKWSISPERKMKEFGHPAMFPEALVERVLKLFSFKGDVILDPFNGVGTTTVVAKRLLRNYIGVDISKEYCEKADKRLSAVGPNTITPGHALAG